MDQLYHIQIKSILMAVYFAGDHFVWAHKIGLTTDKQVCTYVG